MMSSTPAEQRELDEEQQPLLFSDLEHNAESVTPLLIQSSTTGRKHNGEITPLPIVQLLVLAAVRLAEPIASTQVRSVVLIIKSVL